MTDTRVRDAIETVSRMLAEHPEKGRVKSAPATAALLDGLKCQVTGTAGEMLQTTCRRASVVRPRLPIRDG